MLFWQRLTHARPPGERAEADLIVPRGCSPEFYFFCSVFAKEHHARVVIDRRSQERRELLYDAAAERRRTDRRGALPYTWGAGNFIWTPRLP
jgi:hypothetical protein